MIDLELLKSEIERMSGIKNIAEGANHKVCAARAVFFDIARSNTNLTYEKIGEYVSIKNHALVWAGIEKLSKYFKRYPEFREIHQLLIESGVFENKKEAANEEIKKLRKDLEKEKLKVLQMNSHFKSANARGPFIKASHAPLMELINQVPEYHIETVKMRLAPIIRMLERPSIHNNLPRQ